LEQITPELRGHPDVLEIRWQIYAKAKKCVRGGADMLLPRRFENVA
jgi:hypothetical protein